MEKRQILNADEAVLSDAIIESKSLVELQAMRRYQVLHPNEPGAHAWLGLKDQPPAKKVAASTFNSDRLTEVSQVLNQSPIVFLAGLTGVGKTTFIHQVWKKANPACYIGESCLEGWANDHSEGIKTLFIDEANISLRQWSEFEGLFHTPPRMLIDNKIVTLSTEHKVIFAGNPLSYGGERQMPTLFQRHGNSVVFHPMPAQFLYDELLSPILREFDNPEQVAAPILQIAEYCSESNSKEVLISPRELSMMALLTKAYCIKHPKADAVSVASFYAYTLAESHIPEVDKKQFNKRFKPKESLSWVAAPRPGNLLITPANQPSFDALTSFLTLRELRRNQEIMMDGGLGGLIIEGEPGLGKSELLFQTLVAHGLSKCAPKAPHLDEAAFYHIPPSMSFDEKKALLLHAFHAGAIVIMDEINSAPMMERLLNDLLMGTDNEGNRAKKRGFLLIGTQNPSTMAGRTRATSALTHRMQTLVTPEYSGDELVTILVHKGLYKQVARDMVDEYLSLRQLTPTQATPNLCCRDLLTCAQYHIHALSTIEQESKPDVTQTFQQLKADSKRPISAPSFESSSFFTKNKTTVTLSQEEHSSDENTYLKKS